MIDFNKRVKNSDKFRLAAIKFLLTGKYCNFPIGTTEHFLYWETEAYRCLNGYTADDGDFISGYNYFYLNYCPIWRIVYHDKILKDGTVKQVRKRELEFPDFYDYDYYFFTSIQEAEEDGKHMCVLKSRRKGYSYKAGSMCVRNYYMIPGSQSYVYASNKQYLTEDGILTKCWSYMDFIDQHTAWGKKRSVDQTMHKRAGFFSKDEYGNSTEYGFKSDIIGVTLKDNPDVVRGKVAKLIVFEEAGSFSELGAAWQIARPSVEQDGVAFGTMLAFGCVCEGTKIVDNDGNFLPVEQLTLANGVIGWDTYQAVRLNITAVREPSKKPCVEITTSTGKTLRCSEDHPILWSTLKLLKRVPGKRATNEKMKTFMWHDAGKINAGEQVGIIDELPFFGTKEMWEPRIVGMLIGDGSYGIAKTPVFSNCDNELNTYLRERTDCVTERHRITKDGKLYLETRVRGICPELRKLGIYGQTKKAKRLPNDIHSYNLTSLLELLGGLFDTDGYISKRGKIILTLNNAEILLQVLEVLLHFGIHCTVRYIEYKSKTHTINGRLCNISGEYRLEIADKTSVLRFCERIPLLCEYKNAAIDLIQYLMQDKLSQLSRYISGVRFERVISVKPIGEQYVYNFQTDCNHNYIANGFITHNTGGDEGSKFATLKDMFYNPDGYNCKSFPNIWDEGATNKLCGFFIPQYTNLDTRDEDGKRIYMDEDGNTIRSKAVEFILAERRKVIENATNSVTVDRYVAERCITPAEAVLEFSGNIFPKKELQQQLARIRTHKSLQEMKLVGDLTWAGNGSDGLLKWTIKKSGDVTKYPLGKDDDPHGSIVIWEHPIQDAPFGLYIAGIDSYDFDQSTTTSLGSCFIYKRFLAFELNYDCIVAEYTGRPETSEEFYENVRKLLVYYNARAMYENQNKGIYAYFTSKHCDYLLADSPDILTDMSIVKDSKVNRKKGCHMNRQIKSWGEGLIKEWLNEEQLAGIKNLTKIYSEPFLEELISYNDTGNFDRIMSYILVMIYRELLFNVKVKEKEKNNKARLLFDGPIFGDTMYYDDSMSNVEYTNEFVIT